MSGLDRARERQARLAGLLRRSDTHAAWIEARSRFPELVDRTFPEDGFRVASLLVARLRFERMLQGSATLGTEFERDPLEFTRSFKRYHVSTPMIAGSPAEEAAGFEAWRAESVGE